MKKQTGSQQPKKTRVKIENAIHSFFLERHNVNLVNFYGLGQQIMNIINNDVESPLQGSQNIYKFLSAWFKTTNIKGCMEDHSAHGFCVFMDNNYEFIIIDKQPSWLKRQLIKILKA